MQIVGFPMRRLKYFFNSVLRPFQDYFSSYETGQSAGGRKREKPEKNHLAHPLINSVVKPMFNIFGPILINILVLVSTTLLKDAKLQ